MATYSAEIVRLGLSLGLSKVSAVPYRSGVQDTLALSLGIEDVGLYVTRNAEIEPLALSLGFTDVTARISFGIGAQEPLNLSLGLSPARLEKFKLVFYPEIAPSAASFVPPKYPLTKSRTQQGTIVNRLWCASPGDASLSLSYEVVTDDQAEAIMTAWDAARGTHFDVFLRPVSVGGSLGPMKAWLSLEGKRLRWRFASRPEVRALFGGHSSVSVAFRGVSEKSMTPFVSPV